MRFIVRLHAEITIKSKSMRQRLGKVLTGNLRTLLKAINPQVRVRFEWDRITVKVPDGDASVRRQVLERLQTTPGIAHFEEVEQRPFTTFDDVLDWVIETKAPLIENRSFAVRVRRKGKHDFSSQDMAIYLGGGIKARVNGASVNLSKPDCEVNLLLEDDTVSLVLNRTKGIGGFPLPTQESVLSLMSGGFDSAVASFQMMRRGARTHFCFFNLGADAHEAAVREIAYALWEKYSRTHAVKFVSVDFGPVVQKILEDVDNGLMGVMLKRAMLRAASQVAEKAKCKALVTGEAMGQVSSQTLSNLQIIDEVTNTLVLRPLIVSDKNDIVNQAREIGVEDYCASVPEYCGVISQRPNVRVERDAIEAAELAIPDQLINKVVNEAKVIDIRDVHTDKSAGPRIISTSAELPSNAKVIDVRSSDEEDENPLEIENLDVIHIPFFKLSAKYPELDQNFDYLLYCDQGVMSRLQAIHLMEQGFSNVAVYDLK